MKNGLPYIVFLGFYTTSALASIHPVATLTAGVDDINFNMNRNVALISPYHNNYAGSNRSIDFSGGLFLGFESSLPDNLFGQLGLSYYQNTDYQVMGTIYQFGDTTLNDLTYQYNILSERFFLEGKLLTTFSEKYHPYLNAGLGTAINQATQYHETGTNGAVPMTPGFSDHTSHSMAYLVGIGIEMDVADHIRLGCMYRYSGLGNARLGTTSLQESGDVQKNNNLRVNEFLLQLSYLG